MLQKDDAFQRLVKVIKPMALEKRDKLEKMKMGHNELKRTDIIWHLLLQSFSTMGNSRGWDGLIGNQNNYRKVTFEKLSLLSNLQRLSVLEQTLLDAKVRMAVRKAKWLDRNYEYINKLGGLAAVKNKLLRIVGREGKIKFLKSFAGIGEKYARNIMMDVYHEDFRESIAIDDRIKAITEALGLSFKTYADQEQFFLDVAHGAGINGWELDRLMYNFKDEIIQNLRATFTAVGGPQGTSTRLRNKEDKCK